MQYSYVHMISGERFTFAQLSNKLRNVSFAPNNPPAPYAVVQPADPPAYNAVTHKAVETTPHVENGVRSQRWNIVALTAEEVAANVAAAKQSLMSDVAQKRLQILALGFPYQFPDGPGTIQVRDSTDTGNVNGIVTTALVLKSMGVTDPFTAFRDMENVSHPLTPDQAVAMGMAVGAYVAGLYQKKWQKEEEIKAITTPEQLAAFDIDAGWAP